MAVSIELRRSFGLYFVLLSCLVAFCAKVRDLLVFLILLGQCSHDL